MTSPKRYGIASSILLKDSARSSSIPTRMALIPTPTLNWPTTFRMPTAPSRPGNEAASDRASLYKLALFLLACSLAFKMLYQPLDKFDNITILLFRDIACQLLLQNTRLLPVGVMSERHVEKMSPRHAASMPVLLYALFSRHFFACDFASHMLQIIASMRSIEMLFVVSSAFVIKRRHT